MEHKQILLVKAFMTKVKNGMSKLLCGFMDLIKYIM